MRGRSREDLSGRAAYLVCISGLTSDTVDRRTCRCSVRCGKGAEVDVQVEPEVLGLICLLFDVSRSDDEGQKQEGREGAGAAGGAGGISLDLGLLPNPATDVLWRSFLGDATALSPCCGRMGREGASSLVALMDLVSCAVVLLSERGAFGVSPPPIPSPLRSRLEARFRGEALGVVLSFAILPAFASSLPLLPLEACELRT